MLAWIAGIIGAIVIGAEILAYRIAAMADAGKLTPATGDSKGDDTGKGDDKDAGKGDGASKELTPRAYVEALGLDWTAVKTKALESGITGELTRSEIDTLVAKYGPQALGYVGSDVNQDKQAAYAAEQAATTVQPGVSVDANGNAIVQATTSEKPD